MANNKMNRLYNLIIDNEKISYDNLLKNGFSNKEIEDLIDDDIIYETSDGCYTCYIDDLIAYAKELLLNKYIPRYETVIKKCYEFSPKDFEVLEFVFTNEFVKSLRKHNYDKTIDLLYELRDAANEYEMQDVNTLIFLMNFLTDLPDDLRLIAKYAKLNDLLIKNYDDRYEDIKNRNNARRNIYIQKFSLAQKDIKKVSDKTKGNMIYDRAIVKVLEENYVFRKNLNIKLCDLAKDNNIDEIIKICNHEEEKRKLTRYEEYVLKLSKKLEEIINTKSVPIPNHQSNVSFYTMIDNNDFQQALDKSIEMSENNKIAIDQSIYYLLLVKINEEINKLKNKNKLVLTNKNTTK